MTEIIEQREAEITARMKTKLAEMDHRPAPKLDALPGETARETINRLTKKD